MLTHAQDRKGKREEKMPLALVKIGDRVKVVNITGLDSVKKRLGALGLIPGEIVSVVQIAEGNMILAIHDSRLAIGRDVAGHVLCQPL